jgi:hypothetical protein
LNTNVSAPALRISFCPPIKAVPVWIVADAVVI